LCHPAKKCTGTVCGPNALYRDNIAQSEGFQYGKPEPAHRPGSIGQGIAPFVAVPCGIGEFTNADAIQDDQEHFAGIQA
jgi:hypothetical protein